MLEDHDQTSSGRIQSAAAGDSGIALVPHFAHSVFAATLCLWCAVDRLEESTYSTKSTSENPRAKSLRVGKALLTRSIPNAAQVYRNILDKLASVV